VLNNGAYDHEKRINSGQKKMRLSVMQQTRVQHKHTKTVKDEAGVFSTPTRVRHSPYYYLNEYLPRFNIEEIGSPMIPTRNLVQIDIANAIKKVTNSPPGTQERRVAVSNADPEGSGSHWFALCFEITKAP